MNMSFLQELFGNITQRDALLRRRIGEPTHPDHGQLVSACTALLESDGEASSIALAGRALALYARLSAEQKSRFFAALGSDFSADPQAIDAAYAAYRGKLERVRATALRARGASVGSDAWAAASVALAELETERSRTMVALADLDRLYVAAATEGSATDELANAQNVVNEMVEFETAQINEIHATLR